MYLFKSNQASNDVLDLWRDLSTYEANFVNSADTSIVSRLARMKTDIAKTEQKLAALDKRTGNSWINEE